jgi:hypothetical protein
LLKRGAKVGEFGGTIDTLRTECFVDIGRSNENGADVHVLDITVYINRIKYNNGTRPKKSDSDSALIRAIQVLGWEDDNDKSSISTRAQFEYKQLLHAALHIMLSNQTKKYIFETIFGTLPVLETIFLEGSFTEVTDVDNINWTYGRNQSGYANFVVRPTKHEIEERQKQMLYLQ